MPELAKVVQALPIPEADLVPLGISGFSKLRAANGKIFSLDGALGVRADVEIK